MGLYFSAPPLENSWTRHWDLKVKLQILIVHSLSYELVHRTCWQQSWSYTLISVSICAFCQLFQNKQVFERLDNNNDDPNHNYQILGESLINSHNECFPTRVVKFNRKRHNISPWMTNGILKSINHRNRLYKNLKQYKPDSFMYTEKQLQFNRYRNNLKKTITHAKRSTTKIYLNNSNLTWRKHGLFYLKFSTWKIGTRCLIIWQLMVLSET